MDHPPPLPATFTAAVSDPSLDHPVSSSKLRLMVSYGGHILPRPHDKSLTYIGGTTRLLLLDRPTSAAALLYRISRSLPLNSRHFTLKYQLPNDDLDSLVSLSSNEDLHNFLDEYDRLLSSTSPRVRLFLFFDRPSTANSLGPLLERPDDEGWFLDALNSADHLVVLPHCFSDSATNAADLSFCEAEVGDDKVRIEDSDLDRTEAADERSFDQGHTAGVGKPPLQSPQVQVHAVHHKVAVAYNNLPSPDSFTSDSSNIEDRSKPRKPDGSQPMGATPPPYFPYLSALGSEPAYTTPQPQMTLLQQQYGNTSANYVPRAAIAGAGQVFVQSYYPMYVVPARANAGGAYDTCAVSAPSLVQLPYSRQYLPHQQHNMPGIHLSRSTAYAFDHRYNLFDQSDYYIKLPAATKETPQYQAVAVTEAATGVSSDGSK